MTEKEVHISNEPRMMGYADTNTPMMGEKGTTSPNQEKGTTCENLPLEEVQEDLPSALEKEVATLVRHLHDYSEAKWVAFDDLNRAQEQYSTYSNEYMRVKDKINHKFEEISRIHEQAVLDLALAMTTSVPSKKEIERLEKVVDETSSAMLSLVKGLTEVD